MPIDLCVIRRWIRGRRRKVVLARLNKELIDYKELPRNRDGGASAVRHEDHVNASSHSISHWLDQSEANWNHPSRRRKGRW